MKTLLVFLAFFAAVSLHAAAPAHAFDSPVDASLYTAEGGTVVGVRILSLDDETGECRFELVREDGTTPPAVCGITTANTSHHAIAAEIRALIADTLD